MLDSLKKKYFRCLRLQTKQKNQNIGVMQKTVMKMHAVIWLHTTISLVYSFIMIMMDILMIKEISYILL